MVDHVRRGGARYRVRGKIMRVSRLDDTSPDSDQVTEDVERARKFGPLPEPVCRPSCSHYDSKIGCNHQCAGIALHLSSETERYPLEPKIAPLAFEIKRLGVFVPCWSCEGHDHQQGGLWKKPRVWFYSDSGVHVRALTDAINELNTAHKLSTLWGIVLTHSEIDNPSTTFSIEPLEPDNEPGVAPLHQDLLVLTRELSDLFWKSCNLLEKHAK